jgi:Tol biopolymer transport system component
MKKSHLILTISSFITLFVFFNSMAYSPETTKTENILEKITEFNEKLISNSRQLTFEGAKAGEGYFSADGKKMIFQSERHEGNPFYQMFILDLINGKVDRVSPGKGKTTCGWIHPSLKKVMWSSTHLDPESLTKQKNEYESRKKPVQGKYSWSYDEYYDIFESDVKGNNIKRLTKELGYDAEGSYSPDGKEIAFASNRTGYSSKLSPEEQTLFKKDPSSQMEIYIMNADGTNVRQLTKSLGYDGGPFFSHDGSKITWRRFDSTGATAEIYTMNKDGSDQKQVTKLNAMSWAPFFHPSGKYIIFTSSITGYSNFELFIVDSEGLKKPVRVTYEDDFDGLPTFSPDGNKISWTHRNQKGESQIFIADWDHEKALKHLGLNEKFKEKLSSIKFTPEINSLDAKNIIKIIASEDYTGRLSGSDEEKELTKQISELLKQWKISTLQLKNQKNSFVHQFDIITGIELIGENNFALNNKPLTLAKDYRPLSLSKSGNYTAQPMVFAGYGIQAPSSDKFKAYNSYEKLDVKGKWVVLFKDLPSKVDKDLRNHLLPYARLAHKITLAKNLEASGVIFIDNLNLSTRTFLSKSKYDGAPTALPVIELTLEKFLESFNLTDEQFSKMQSALESNIELESLGSSSSVASGQISLKLNKKVASQLIGFIEAPKKTNKSIIIGAHMDHLGQGEIGNSLATSNESSPIHYGADDNASGVAGVLELAHYFSKNKNKLKYNIYFALWSAEEMGVLGSQNFVETWEEIKRKKISDEFIASLNMDMIGRFNEKLYIQGTGSSLGWNKIVEGLALKHSISLSVQKDPYLPTDSISFYLKDIPSISFFTGVHSDYHTPRDTFDKINYEGMVKIINVVKAFTEEIFMTPLNQLKFEKVEGSTRVKGSERSFRIYLGTIPDYSQDGVQGVRISGVSKNSPAEKAGLQSKDIIVEFNGKPIDSIHDYVFGLQAAEPKKEVPIKIKRAGELVNLKITPEIKE